MTSQVYLKENYTIFRYSNQISANAFQPNAKILWFIDFWKLKIIQLPDFTIAIQHSLHQTLQVTPKLYNVYILLLTGTPVDNNHEDVIAVIPQPENRNEIVQEDHDTPGIFK